VASNAINLTPLRERENDLEMLARFFCC